MIWRKHGRLFDPREAGFSWMSSHAQLPVADRVEGSTYRVYFASRNKDQVSSVGCVVVRLGNRPCVEQVLPKPVLEPGPIGTFDEHGVFPSCIVNLPDRKRMYYIGWNRGVRAPLFYAAIGVADSTDGGSTWRKRSPAPILSRSEHDPCLVTSPHVMRYGDCFRMTYVSGIRWEEAAGGLRSYYHIKYAESQDGLDWRRDGWVAVDFAGADETNVARSSVIELRDRLGMWFCFVRGEARYRIGYAESKDFLSWSRNDAAAGIGVSADGWDSEMVCYPNVFREGGRLYMLYNGNAFGRDGFGIASAEE